jgi:A/G-specific adenine glycosylase
MIKALSSDSKIQDFQELILKWFSTNSRDFPWRKKSISKYQIIISEILLQRTKAETAAKFYPKFIKKYPSWKQLGEASQIELQQAFKPIGLYIQRGNRLFALAQEMKKRKGLLPKNREEIEEIPMMGQYLSNAYELFVLNRPSPLLDVNMARVLERYFGKRQLSDIRFDPYLQDLSHKLVNHPNSKELNWAILDLGALICTNRHPLCFKCPLNVQCKHNLSL